MAEGAENQPDAFMEEHASEAAGAETQAVEGAKRTVEGAVDSQAAQGTADPQKVEGSAVEAQAGQGAAVEAQGLGCSWDCSGPPRL